MQLLGYKSITADVALVTTAETVIVTSPRTNTPRDEAEVIVIAWAQLTTGTNTTAVTPRIRRGGTAAGTLVGEANPITVGAAAGSTEQFDIVQTEQLRATSVEYSLTLEQTGASANGAALQATIIVLGR